MNMEIYQTLNRYLKYLKEKWNLWGMAAASSSGPDNNDTMENGSASIEIYLNASGLPTQINYISARNTTTIPTISTTPLFLEIYSNTTNNITYQIKVEDGILKVVPLTLSQQLTLLSQRANAQITLQSVSSV